MTDKATLEIKKRPSKMMWNSKFDHFCRWASFVSDKPIAFNSALAIIVFWMLSGPVLGFSDIWRLIINTATTIVSYYFPGECVNVFRQ